MGRPPRWLVVTPVLGTLALGAAGAWFYVAQRQYLQHIASANLLTTAQAKVDQIVAWRTERLGNAAALQESPFFVPAVARWLAGRQPEIAADILTRLRSTKDHYGYDDVRLVDRAGRVVLATSGRLGALDPDEARALRSALRDRRPTISDVHMSSDDSFPHLTLVAPLFAPSGRSAGPIGAVVYMADPRRSLFRLVESWPSPSPSAEALLVRRDGDSVLFLSERRFQPALGIPRRISLSRRDVPAVMAVLGTEGVVQGVDYRGRRVIAALRAVPGTPWFLVAKVDEAEALAVWRTRVALVFALLLGLVLAAAATAIALGQRLAKARYRRLYEAEAALGASKARFQTLVEEAGDGFALLDAEGRYLDVNSECCLQLGYAREELLRLRVSDVDSLFTPQQFAADFQSLVGKRPVTYESVHRRKDGTTFPVEVTLSISRIGNVPQAMSLARDITERKRAAEVMRENQREIAEALEFNRSILRTSSIGILAYRHSGQCTFANEAAAKIVGTDGAGLLAQDFHRIQSWKDSGIYDTACKALATDTEQQVEAPLATTFGRDVWLNLRFSTFHSGGERHLLVFAYDVTERKRAEEALHAKEQELRILFEELPIGVSLMDQNLKVTYANQRLEQILGLSRDDLLQGKHQERRYLRSDGTPMPPEEYASVRALREQRSIHAVETGIVAEDGRTIWTSVSAAPFPAANKGVLVATADITERKRAEEALRESEERYRSIIEQLNDVYYRTDRDGCITMMSPSAAHLFGFPSTSEMIGRPMESLWRDPSQRAALLAAIGERGFVRDYGVTAVRTDGTPFAIAVSSHYVRDAAGAADGVEGIIRDITERKQTEAALHALARHLDSVREEEHIRIARQVHDELGQALTALRLDLTWVGRKLPKGNAALRSRIDAAVALTDETITVGQRIVGELRPPILDDLGLVPAVEWYAQHFAKRSGLRIELDAGAEEPAVPDRLAVTAYRIVQEALANVARHAQATHVRVRLGAQDGALTIEIRDDGQGFREEAARDPHSFGIVGMRERAASHGGELAITSSPGAGTTVRVTFPLERRKRPRAPR